MRRGTYGLFAACALTLALGACNTAGERAAGGALAGGGIGAGIGAAAGGPHGALVGGLAGAATGAVVGAATTPPALQPRFVYVETLPACPDWRARTVRSSSDAFDCRDERGWMRPRRAPPPRELPEYGYGY